MREHGVDRKVTVQKICRVCKDERDVRAGLNGIWQNPAKVHKVLAEALTRNLSVFEFEKTLNR